MQAVQPIQTGIRVTKLLIHETGTYNPQFRRAYNTNLDNATMQSVIERVAGAEKYKPLLLAGVANQFIMPSATPEKELKAPGVAWQERRARFMMEIEHTYAHLGTTITEVILGYTDHMGISGKGYIDPKMVFFVNSTLQVRQVFERTPMGMSAHLTVLDSSQVLADNDWKGIYAGQKDHRLRPEDIYSTMGRLNAEIGGATDMRTVLTNVAVKSRRSNTLPASYMASIMENHKNASITQEFGSGTQDILTSARGLAAESSVVKDPFMSAISQIRGVPPGNWFTCEELLMLDPNATSDQVCVVQILGPTNQNEVHQAGFTQQWGGSDRDTLAATVLSQSVPALMMELMLTKVVFKSSNHTIGGAIYTQVLSAQGFSDVDLTPYIQRFMVELENVVLRDLSMGGQIGFNVEMQVDLVGETWIKVQFENDAPVDFVTPSFADALMTPVVTSNGEQALNVARDFDLLINHVAQEVSGFNAAVQGIGGTPFGNI